MGPWPESMVFLLLIFLAAASLKFWMSPHGPALCTEAVFRHCLSCSIKTKQNTEYSLYLFPAEHGDRCIILELFFTQHAVFLVIIIAHFSILIMSFPICLNYSLAMGVCCFHWGSLCFTAGQVGNVAPLCCVRDIAAPLLFKLCFIYKHSTPF